MIVYKVEALKRWVRYFMAGLFQACQCFWFESDQILNFLPDPVFLFWIQTEFLNIKANLPQFLLHFYVKMAQTAGWVNLQLL